MFSGSFSSARQYLIDGLKSNNNRWSKLNLHPWTKEEDALLQHPTVEGMTALKAYREKESIRERINFLATQS